MKTSALLVLALAAVLPLAVLRPAAAATQATVVAQATGAKDLFTFSYLDDGNGNFRTDDLQTQKIHDAFANIQYLITDQNNLLIGQMSGGNFTPLLDPGVALDVNNGKGYYLIHLRSKLTFLDGTIYRYTDQPNEGIARLVLTLLDSKGNSSSTYIEQPLTWGSNQPSSNPSPSPTPNPFGF